MCLLGSKLLSIHLKMKISAALASILALQAAALPGKLLRRGISDAAVELIGSLEGFRPDFYYINGHKTVGAYTYYLYS